MNNYEKWKSENNLDTEIDVVSKIVEDVSDPIERCAACPARDFCRNKFPGNQDYPWLEDICPDVIHEWANQTSS